MMKAEKFPKLTIITVLAIALWSMSIIVISYGIAQEEAASYSISIFRKEFL